MPAPLLAPIFAQLTGALARIAPAASSAMQAQAAATAATARTAGATAAASAGRVIPPPVHPAYRPPTPPPPPAVAPQFPPGSPFGPSGPSAMGSEHYRAQDTGKAATKGGPLSGTADMLVDGAAKTLWGLAKDGAILAMPWVKISQKMADAGETVTRDILDLGRAAAESANVMAPLAKRLTGIADEKLSELRPLAQYSGGQALAFAQLDASRTRRDIYLGNATAASTYEVTKGTAKLEERLARIEAVGINIQNGILSRVLVAVEKGLAASETMLKVIAEYAKTVPGLGKAVEAIEKKLDDSGATALTDEASAKRLTSDLSGAWLDRKRPPIGVENLGRAMRPTRE